MADGFTILLVEDNPDDVLLFRRALASVKPRHNLVVVEDGVNALSYLQNGDSFKNAARPDIIFLDLNISFLAGLKVLEEVKADPELHRIPVIILTNSGEDELISKAYSLHTNGYIVKPVNFENFIEVIQKTCNFWLNIAILPKNNL